MKLSQVFSHLQLFQKCFKIRNYRFLIRLLVKSDFVDYILKMLAIFNRDFLVRFRIPLMAVPISSTLPYIILKTITKTTSVGFEHALQRQQALLRWTKVGKRILVVFFPLREILEFSENLKWTSDRTRQKSQKNSRLPTWSSAAHSNCFSS